LGLSISSLKLPTAAISGPNASACEFLTLLRDHHGVAVNKVVGPFELSWAEIERDKADLKAQRSGYPIATAT
jgi:hypothetical protein